MLYQAFNIVIYCGLSSPVHSKEVVKVLNDTETKFLFHLISTVQGPFIQSLGTHIAMHTSAHNYDVSLSQ